MHLFKKKKGSIYKPVLGKPVVFRRHRASQALRVHILLRATSAKKSLRKGGTKRRRTALTAESDCCTATHRAKTSRGRASCGRLFKFLFIFGTINKWSARVKTSVYGSLLGCHNPVALPGAHWPWLKKNDQEGKVRVLGVLAVVALAEDPTGPGSGTVRLCCPPL